MLDLDLEKPVDAIFSTATLHWVADHDRLWIRLAQALRPGGVLEIQCGGEGNIEGVRKGSATALGLRAPQPEQSITGLRRGTIRLSATASLEYCQRLAPSRVDLIQAANDLCSGLVEVGSVSADLNRSKSHLWTSVRAWQNVEPLVELGKELGGSLRGRSIRRGKADKVAAHKRNLSRSAPGSGRVGLEATGELSGLIVWGLSVAPSVPQPTFCLKPACRPPLRLLQS